jgi:hypothetical protein
LPEPQSEPDPSLLGTGVRTQFQLPWLLSRSLARGSPERSAALMEWMRSRVGTLGLWVRLLLAVFLLGVYQAYPIPDSSPLLQFGGQVRQRYLYTDDDQDTEAHLEIREDGTVVGAAHRSPESECGDGASWRLRGGGSWVLTTVDRP